jgi:hypothetical protein
MRTIGMNTLQEAWAYIGNDGESAAAFRRRVEALPPEEREQLLAKARPLAQQAMSENRKANQPHLSA